MISNHRRRNLVWPIAIFIAAALACEPALLNTYTFDDMAQVRDLAVPESAGGLLRAAAEPWWPPERGKNLWRPVTRLTILAQKGLGGDSPQGTVPGPQGTVPGPHGTWPYYAFNIILHGAVAVLLFLLARRLGLTETAAGLGALIFAVHPAHAEAVHQIVGRAELLAAFFMLIGLILFWDSLKIRAKARTPNFLFWVAQPLCFALALGSKEHALIYPFLLFVLIYSSRSPSRNTHSAFWELCAILLLVFALFLKAKAAITGGVLESPASVPLYENPLATMPLAQRIPAALGILGYAASRMVLPVWLSPDYSAFSLPFERGWGWPDAWLGLLVILVPVAWGIRNARRGGRGWAMAAAALGSYLLVGNLFFTIGVSTAQRLWYWPSAPVCLGLGCGLAAVGGRLGPERRRMGALLAVALIAGLMAAGWKQAREWRSPEHFARATIEIFPRSWRGQVDTARACYRERDFAGGREHALAATRAFPGLADGWAWLGANAMFLAGRQTEAEGAFKVALELNPELYEAHRHYGHLLALMGRKAEAAEQLQAFLQAEGPSAADREKVQGELETLFGVK